MDWVEQPFVWDKRHFDLNWCLSTFVYLRGTTSVKFEMRAQISFYSYLANRLRSTFRSDQTSKDWIDFLLTLFCNSESVDSRPWNQLEVQSHKLYSRSTESEILGMQPITLNFFSWGLNFYDIYTSTSYRNVQS